MARRIEMTDERIDALIRRLDVPSDADPDFVRSTSAALRPRARAARVSDASRIGRMRRDLRLVLAGARWPAPARPVGMVGPIVLLVLLVVATTVALAVVGALNHDVFGTATWRSPSNAGFGTRNDTAMADIANGLLRDCPRLTRRG
jgi:hypothetical protein